MQNLLNYFTKDIIFKKKKIMNATFSLFLLFLSFTLGFALNFQSVPPTMATGYFLNKTLKTDAFCLDGSGPLYYHLPGVDSGSNKWYFHFEGGGCCSSLSDCFSRSQTNLGSTLQDLPFRDFSDANDYFSNDESINPLMFNWNKVYMRYCDGGSFSGNNVSLYQDHALFFKGRKIMDAIFQDLLVNRGLNLATDAVVSGCSAGGLASILHGDHVRDMLPKETRVVVMPDSGFFLDYVGLSVDYHSLIRWAYVTMNSREGVNRKCVEFYGPKDDWKCFFAEYTVPFIESPVFILQSLHDSWQIDWVLGSKNATLVTQFGDEVLRRLGDSFLSFEKNSGFVDSCYHHGGYWNGMHIANKTQSQSFYEWYMGSEKQAYVQNKDYPCVDCCS